MSLCEVQKQSQKLNEVTTEKENWNIIIRVVRSWFVPDLGNRGVHFQWSWLFKTKR